MAKKKAKNKAKVTHGNNKQVKKQSVNKHENKKVFKQHNVEVKKETKKKEKRFSKVASIKKVFNRKPRAEVTVVSKKGNKYSLLKWILGSFFILVVLSWLINAGTFSGFTFTESGKSPIGLYDLVSIPLETFTSYAVYGLYILIIGGLYGVMKRTGAYDVLVEKIANIFKNHKKLGLSLIALLFGVVSSLSGLQLMLLVIVPLFMDVLRKLDYSRMSSLMATIGAILIGNVASMYGFNIAGYSSYYLSFAMNDAILTKAILFVMLIVLLIFFVIRHNVKEISNEVVMAEVEETALEESEDEEAEEIIEEVVEVKKRKLHVWPLVLLLSLTVIFILVAGYNWEYGASYSEFTTLYENIVANYAWLYNILGNIIPLGYWGVGEISFVLILVTFIIGWLYSVRIKDMVEAFVEGAKEAMMPAIYVTLASIIIYSVFGSSTGSSIYFTISNAVLELSKTFNVFVMTLFSVVGGLFVNDFTYFMGYMNGLLTGLYTDTALYQHMALIMEAVHGIMMMLVPTSMVLVAGLSHLKLNYGDYLKYVWKFLLEIFVVCMIVFVVIGFIM